MERVLPAHCIPSTGRAELSPSDLGTHPCLAPNPTDPEAGQPLPSPADT